MATEDHANGWFQKHVLAEFERSSQAMGEMRKELSDLRDEIVELKIQNHSQQLRITVWATLAATLPGLVTALFIWLKMPHG